MAGVAVQITDEGFEAAIQSIEGIEQLDQSQLLDATGRLLQESTRNRIRTTKTSPDGAKWQANRAGTSTLLQSGNLAASIDYAVSGSALSVGSALVYSRIHQFGGEIKPKSADKLAFMVGNKLVFATKVTIPARPYIGLSEEDRNDVLDMIGDVLTRTVQ